MSRAVSALGRYLLLPALALLAGCAGSRPEQAPPAVNQAPEASYAADLPASSAQDQEPAEVEGAGWAEPPRVAEDPIAIAGQLTLAERVVRDGDASPAELAWTAQLQQLVYRRLVNQAELREPVLAAVADDVTEAARSNLSAGVSLRALISPRESLPRWRILDPAPLDELLSHYRAAEDEFSVPWEYLAAVHLVETVMGRIRGTSVAGAQGPMQFMPTTWAAYGEGDIHDTRDSIRAAARYLRANGAPGNMAAALYRYNPSQHYVDAVTAYAGVMRAAPEAVRGYYHWQVFYLTKEEDSLLPVGYSRD
jgi:membrane-bound lytic murein transglycosylase B